MVYISSSRVVFIDSRNEKHKIDTNTNTISELNHKYRKVVSAVLLIFTAVCRRGAKLCPRGGGGGVPQTGSSRRWKVSGWRLPPHPTTSPTPSPHAHHLLALPAAKLPGH